eukprot:scaffold3768_cov376-Prasinococcus_capsulatus_cf.AAC.36
MDDLAAMPQTSFPCLLVCAGNRRKEQNQIKQSIGFNWGNCACANTVWTGVLLCDLLKRVGVTKKDANRRYVCFAGPQKELPREYEGQQGGPGSYGTSVSMEEALDPACGILIAWKQNGELLSPDHGFPVRLVIPGYIGGRMIKWLSDITVTSEESNNFFHYNDNRVLPPPVDVERAGAEGWWFKPEYIINQLNINGAISRPNHGDTMKIADEMCTVNGYAYTGGGRKIIRCEISLDGGMSWKLATISTEELPRMGRYWCWFMWEIVLSKKDLQAADELLFRAYDEAQNAMPERPTWNVMGMMNNPWYRVRIHHLSADEIAFEHPTQAGPNPGGWMVKMAEAAGGHLNWGWGGEGSPAWKRPAGYVTYEDVFPSVVPVPPPAPVVTEGKRLISWEEIAQHKTEDDVWIVVAGKVYDATGYLKDHPGGAESIMINAATDTTDEFLAIHSKKAWALLDEYEIGVVDPNSKPVVDSAAETGPGDFAVSPREYRKFKLANIETLSHDTKRWTFALQTKDTVLGLPVGKHLLLRAKIGDKNVIRAYTPTSSDKDLGIVQFVIKVYPPLPPKFPLGGVFSQYMDSLEVGDLLEMKGALGEIVYHGRGRLSVNNVERQVTHIAILAAGTGITPGYQIMKAIYEDADDTTEVSLIYANKSETDILVREDIDKFAQKQNINRWYTVDNATPGWKFSSGYVNYDMIKKRCAPASATSIALLCGPPGFCKYACQANLEKLGYDENTIKNF